MSCNLIKNLFHLLKSTDFPWDEWVICWLFVGKGVNHEVESVQENYAILETNFKNKTWFQHVFQYELTGKSFLLPCMTGVGTLRWPPGSRWSLEGNLKRVKARDAEQDGLTWNWCSTWSGNHCFSKGPRKLLQKFSWNTSFSLHLSKFFGCSLVRTKVL